MQPRKKKTVSVRQAAKRRPCSINAIMALVYGGRVSAQKRGGRWQIDLAELENYWAGVDAQRRNRGRSPESTVPVSAAVVD